MSKQLDCIALKTSNLNRARYISAMRRNGLEWSHAEIINTDEVLKPGEAGIILRRVSLRPLDSERSLLGDYHSPLALDSHPMRRVA